MSGKTRILKTKLSAVIGEEERRKISATAESIGIAPNTVRTLLRDDWDQLARDTIERTCDRFGLEIKDLFELVPDDFWTPFEEAKKYTILTGAEDTKSGRQLLDENVASMIAISLRGMLPSVVNHRRDDLKEVDEIINYVMNHNCIVVGSPRSNPLTEVVVSQYFGARPFLPQDRRKIPVRFVFAKEDETAKKSTLVEPWRQGRGKRSGLGLCDRKGKLIVEADWWPRSEFLAKILLNARDCGLVLVVEKPFGTNKNVKLVVLAGFSGMGTEGAARALIRDFRDLEPLLGSRYVLGLVEVTYKKTNPGRDNRVFVGYRWKYLVGGRKRLP